MALGLNIVTKPTLPPYQCMRCLAQPEIREYFLDTGVDTEYSGRIYFCNMCMRDITNVDPESFTRTEVNGIVATTQETLAHADQLIADYKSKHDYLLTVGINLDNVIINLKEADDVKRGIIRSEVVTSDLGTESDVVTISDEQPESTGAVESVDSESDGSVATSNPFLSFNS